MARDPISQQHLAELRLKRISTQHREVADLMAENARLKELIKSHGIDPSATPRDPARGNHPDVPAPAKVVSETIEPVTTPLPTEPEAVETDESEAAADWGGEPVARKTARKTARK